MHLLAIHWGNVGIQILHLILMLSILVILHEFGHYITARMFGCRVEKFYLFFDPWFSLFKKKIGDTEYGIGWLPLGGYVKIAGMIDESMDTEAMKQPAQPWEFRSKPAWQRLIIMLGGIIVNVLLAIILYAFVLFKWGEDKIPLASLKYGVDIQDSTLYKVGLRNGDKLLSIDGKEIDDLNTFRNQLLVGKNVQLIRNDQKMNIDLPVDFIGQLVENKIKRGFILPRIPVLVDSVSDTSKAFIAGLRKNDYIVAIDSQQMQFFDELRPVLLAKKGQTILLTVNRNGQDISFQTPVSAEGTIGFTTVTDTKDMEKLGWLSVVHHNYGLLSSIPAGFKMTFSKLESYIDQFKLMLNRKTGAYKGMGGFKSMGKAMPVQFGDWQYFWSITAFISIILAFMNFLPIPALDGGHVLFTLYEMITGRKPHDKFLEYAQMAGMIILLAFMLFANGNDWFGWGK
ncbi:MAG: RIP metalloprotease RseP [Chitinophagaceae bacterium]